MKRKVWIIGGAALVLLVAVALLTHKDEGVQITVSKVGRETLVSKVSANGKIQAVRKADLSANLSGQVTRLTVKEGDRVKEGQFLLEIDPARTKAYVESLEAALHGSLADLESTKANMEQARADFSRAESNYKNGIISVQEYETAKTRLTTYQSSLEAATKRIEQSKATLEQAKVDHAKTVILSPMDGIVTSRRIEAGETAVIGTMNQPGTVLLTISDMSKVETEMEVDEASIPNVKNGLDAQVRIDAYPNQTFKGIVTEVGGSPLLQSGQQAAVKFKVKVQILDPPDTIKPGLSAQADIFTGTSENALAIPFQALVVRDKVPKEGETFKKDDKKEEEGVFLVEGDTVKFVVVKTGLAGDMSIEALDGLKEGDLVASGPLRALRDLRDGAKVKADTKNIKAPPNAAAPNNAK